MGIAGFSHCSIWITTVVSSMCQKVHIHVKLPALSWDIPGDKVEAWGKQFIDQP